MHDRMLENEMRAPVVEEVRAKPLFQRPTPLMHYYSKAIPLIEITNAYIRVTALHCNCTALQATAPASASPGGADLPPLDGDTLERSGSVAPPEDATLALAMPSPQPLVQQTVRLSPR